MMSPMFSNILDIDERGGFLGQVDLVSVADSLNEKPEFSAGFEKWCERNEKNTREEGNIGDFCLPKCGIIGIRSSSSGIVLDVQVHCCAI